MPNLTIDENADKNTKSGETKPTKPVSNIRRFGPLIALAAIAGFIYAMGWHRYFSFEQLAANRKMITGLVADHFVLSVLGFALAYAAVTSLSLPVGSFLTILGGFLFGPLIGGTATVVGATIGALLIFFIVRTSLGETLAEKAGPFIEKLRDGFKENALSYMFFLRLAPVFPFWLVNIAPALLGVRTSTYLTGTFFGIMPATYTFSYIGAGLGSVIDAQGIAYQQCLNRNDTEGIRPLETGCNVSFNPGDLVTPELLIAFAGLAIIALIPVILNKFRKK